MDTENLGLALFIVGDNGKYQKRTMVIFSTIVFTLSFIIMSPTYLYAMPRLLCEGDHCKLECVSSEVTADYRLTNIVTDLSLFCERSQYIPILQSMVFFGAVIGGVILCTIADCYGRRVGLLISIMCSLMGSLSHTTSTTISDFLIANFLLGFGAQGAYVIIIVIINECYSKQIRQQMIILLLMLWAASQLFTAAYYYSFKEWRLIYTCAATIPLLLCLLSVYFFVFESPSYQHANQKQKACLDTLNAIAKVNGRAFVTQNDIQCDELLKVKDNQGLQIYTIFDLFRYKSLRVATIGFCIASFTIHLLYYGGQYGISKIATQDDMYIIAVAVAISELVTNICIQVYITRMKRVTGSSISLCLAIITCFCFFYSEHLNNKIIYAILALFERMFITVGFSFLSIHPIEFYPTVIRTIGSGFMYSIGIVGSMAAPFLLYWSGQLNVNPFLMLGVVCVIGPFGILLVEETLGKPLKDKIQEIL